ncbi:ROK family protein [Bacillus solitudinis]|uniref:ROK family protein n=1 Tax=Bacillus solitudinis TaxID=2014074 RepID=UPI000C24B4DE|nr:ROK family protein [Bacillus solitudinis]
MYIIGVDLGGTQIRVGIFTKKGRLLYKKTVMTLSEEGPDYVISRIKTLIHDVFNQQNNLGKALIGIGIGSPGPLDVFEGVVKSPSNLQGWINIPLREVLEEEFRVPVYLNNDANAAVLGEYFFGNGMNRKSIVYLTISTGVGCGVIDNGRLQLGSRGSAAEIGHMIINPDGPLCGCGNKGCVEAFVSGTGIVKRMKQKLDNDERVSTLRGRDITTQCAFDAAQKKDALALEVIQETIRYLGITLVNIIHLYNPETIIFGGGVSKVGDYLLKPAISYAKKNTIGCLADNIEFKTAKLGEDVGLIGAAALVIYNKQLAYPE